MLPSLELKGPVLDCSQLGQDHPEGVIVAAPLDERLRDENLPPFDVGQEVLQGEVATGQEDVVLEGEGLNLGKGEVFRRFLQRGVQALQ